MVGVVTFGGKLEAILIIIIWRTLVMSKKRGLSVEEKRTRMLELFFEKKDFYQLKELERIAQKEKGITSMSVKDILQSLVDDGLVDSDRIGTSNYFWAFPSKAINNRKRKLSALESKFAESEAKKARLQGSVTEASQGREESEEREQLLKSLEVKSALKKKLSAELEKYKSCDPERMKELRQESSVAKEAANRWTENVFAVKSWCKNRFGVEENKLDKQFGIPEDFDYI